MKHIPYGYRIENRMAVVDEAGAGTMRKFFDYYISGLALMASAEKTGLKLYHGSAGRMLRNEKYIRMPFYRKPIRWISSIKSGCRIMESYRSIMWKTAIYLLSPVTSICRCRRKWCGEQTSIVGRSGSTAASMLYPVSYIAPSAAIFTAGLHGITAGNTPLLEMLHPCGAWPIRL